MRRIALIALGAAIVATAVAAEEAAWQPLDGDGIHTTLTDRKVVYDNAWQHFYASGRTLYNAGEDSWGYWRVDGDRYCSQWPPGGQWDCYVMARSGDSVRFISEFGDATDGTIAP